jgi:hypothetical protein
LRGAAFVKCKLKNFDNLLNLFGLHHPHWAVGYFRHFFDDLFDYFPKFAIPKVSLSCGREHDLVEILRGSAIFQKPQEHIPDSSKGSFILFSALRVLLAEHATRFMAKSTLAHTAPATLSTGFIRPFTSPGLWHAQ